MEKAIPVLNAGPCSIKFGILTAMKGDFALEIAYHGQTERICKTQKIMGMPCTLWTGIKKDLA